MKVAVLLGSFPVISETFIFRKIQALSEAGCRVTVYSRRKGDKKLMQEYARIMHPSIRVKYMIPDSIGGNKSEYLRLFFGLLRYFFTRPISTLRLYRKSAGRRDFLKRLPFMKFDHDVIHCEFMSIGDIYSFLLDSHDIPMVISSRGIEINTFDQKSESEQKSYLELMQRVSGIHCVSEDMAKKVIRISGVDRSKILVNRPAVYTDQYKDLPIQRSNEVPVLVSVGRLMWKKGFDYLLEVYRRLQEEGVEFKAYIIGDGELYSPLKFGLLDLELRDRVTLTGYVAPEKVRDYLQQADIFVLSSHSEGISNAVLEAMASGLPIVTTKAGGMDEAINYGVEGYTLEVRDIPAMKEHLKKLILDQELRWKLGKGSRDRADKEFNILRQAENFVDFYKKLMT